MNRYQAFLAHLGISAVAFLALLYLIVFIWYPQPYFSADGGWQGIRIIAGVDLVLGPILTLIVYKPGKPRLKLDLAVIALLQVAALSWGTWQVHDGRTTLVTFADGIFYSLTPGSVAMAGDKAKQFIDRAKHPPAYAVVRLPADPKALLILKLNSAAQGSPLYTLGDRYEPLGPKTLPLVYAHSLDVTGVAKTRPDVQVRLDDFLARVGGEPAAFAFLPLQCRFRNLVLALRRHDGTIAGTLDIDPATLQRERVTQATAGNTVR